MLESAAACWPLLNDAARSFSGPIEAFSDIVASGAVRVWAKRAGFAAEPIHDFLRRVGKASLFSQVSILPSCNEIMVLLDPAATNDRRLAAELARDGTPLISLEYTVTFREVRLERPSLEEAAAAAGYSIKATVPKPNAGRRRSAKRPGPRAGQVRRFEASDRALFSGIETLIAAESLSVGEAARRLADQGKVGGRGTSESRARRLADLYRASRSH